MDVMELRRGGANLMKGVKIVGKLQYLWRSRVLSIDAKVVMLEGIAAPSVIWFLSLVLNAMGRRVIYEVSTECTRNKC